jgi:hypothetical protein
MAIDHKQVVVPGASRGDYLINPISGVLHSALGSANPD